MLAQLGLAPDEVRPPGIDETPAQAELPRDYCRRVALAKAAAVDADEGDIVLCADTVVALGRRILGKPEDAGQAGRFLGLLSGRRHKVITAVAVKSRGATRCRDVVSTVRMKRLSSEEIALYLATGDWRGKAGGYGIQGPAGALIPWISGSFTAIVGLPLAETAVLLRAAGYPIGQAP